VLPSGQRQSVWEQPNMHRRQQIYASMGRTTFVRGPKAVVALPGYDGE
jgi:hypothetical protein